MAAAERTFALARTMGAHHFWASMNPHLSFALLLSGALLASPGPESMPPQPGGDPVKAQRHMEEVARLGLDRPGQILWSTAPEPLGLLEPLAGTGTYQFPVVLVDFPDMPQRQPPAAFQDLYFGTDTGPAGSVRDYYEEVSGGRVDIGGDTIGWYTLPDDHDSYGSDGGGAGSGYLAAYQAAELAIASNPDMDWSLYDSNQDGYVDGLLVIHAGHGAEESSREGSENNIWSHKWRLSQFAAYWGYPGIDGLATPTPRPGHPGEFIRIDTYTIIPELQDVREEDGLVTIGVAAHELGHVFGLPDLYDTSGGGAGLGLWSLMAGGSWGGGGPLGSALPTRLDAWSRAHLGWVEPQTVWGTERLVSIGAAGSSEEDVLRLRSPDMPPDEYFLVENRQASDWDAELPSTGLAIYHIDEGLLDAWMDANSVNSSAHGTYAVALEEADSDATDPSTFDLFVGNGRGDSGDLWRAGWGDHFGTATAPSTALNDGRNSRLELSLISESGPVMTARLSTDGMLCAEDRDGDGFGVHEGCDFPDCDDADPSVHPRATEVCNGRDDDCDGSEDEDDLDGDGWRRCEGDCDDTNARVHPGADDRCDNGVDEDCSGGDEECLLPPYCLVDDSDLFFWIEVPEGEPLPPEYGLAEALALTDEDQAEVTLEVPFSFHGNSHDRLVVSPNGWTSFDSGPLPPAWEDEPLPSPRFETLLAPWWDDFNPEHCGQATHLAYLDQTVITWEICRYGGDLPYRFQLLLDPLTDAIHYQYDLVAVGDLETDHGSSGHAGIQRDAGHALMVWSRGTGVEAGMRLSMHPMDRDADGGASLACGGFDCDDEDPLQGLPEGEICDGLDNDCNGVADDAADGDGDGIGPCEGDCDDEDPLVYPGADELCDGKDSNCDGYLGAEESDGDADGYLPCTGDCDDSSSAIRPGAIEICDGRDNDCDGNTPEQEEDRDGDGQRGCAGDCDEDNPLRYLGAEEQCNGIDDDCNGYLPDPERDFDGDGVAPCGGDCDDGDSLRHPGAEEACNGIDDDCSGTLDAGERDEDQDGSRPCSGDCNDEESSIFPGATELCNGMDDDCDGATPQQENDNDGDGYSSCAGDCDDSRIDQYPTNLERCGDLVDQDCDGMVDEAPCPGEQEAGCSCSTRSGTGGGWLVLPLLLWTRRRWS